MDRRLKNKSVQSRLGKRVVDQDWAGYKEEGNERKYVWQEGQWCPGGLTRSQKRRVQRLRNKELEQAQASSKPQVWRARQTADRGQPSANIQMAFLLPSEFRACNTSGVLKPETGHVIICIAKHLALVKTLIYIH